MSGSISGDLYDKLLNEVLTFDELYTEGIPEGALELGNTSRPIYIMPGDALSIDFAGKFEGSSFPLPLCIDVHDPIYVNKDGYLTPKQPDPDSKPIGHVTNISRHIDKSRIEVSAVSSGGFTIAQDEFIRYRKNERKLKNEIREIIIELLQNSEDGMSPNQLVKEVSNEGYSEYLILDVIEEMSAPQQE